jgi:alkylation response protein AidB-like acyl-CoA dehydrogenase
LNAELQQLTDAARQVVSGHGIALDEQAGWQLVSELGWLMVAVPEEQGGLGMGPAALAALHQELGRGLGSVPFLPQILGIEAVAASTHDAGGIWLESMMAGEHRVTTPLGQSAITADEDEDGKVLLNGLAQGVPSLDRADSALLASADARCVVLVAMDKPGITVSYRPTWDKTRRLFDMRMENVRVESSRILAQGEAALALCRRLVIQRDFALAADSVGGASALLEATIEYLQTRQQFGRPLALFQALKHRCADLKAETEGARALLESNLTAAEDGSGNLLVTASTEFAACEAKQLACATFSTVAEESLQLHGGIGMTEEHECHLFLKRALLNEQLGGRLDRYDIDLCHHYLNHGQAETAPA